MLFVRLLCNISWRETYDVGDLDDLDCLDELGDLLLDDLSDVGGLENDVPKRDIFQLASGNVHASPKAVVERANTLKS